ncbi:MAG: ribose 5-phosphate isomerase B [Planctomycetota bacterium]
MKVSIGSDHRGVEERKCIIDAVESAGCEAVDLGTHSAEPCDYPDVAMEVAKHVAQGDSDRGILICGTGIGVSMAANKVKGIRAALCKNVQTAELSRQHNNANVLCMGTIDFDPELVRKMIGVWLTTDFEGGRHERRVNKIAAIQLEECSSPSSGDA